MTDAVMVFITAGSEEEASTIAGRLVDEHLIACANVVAGIRSIFFWEGKTQDAQEVLLICKSRQGRLPDLIERVKSLHSYTVPEIVALPIVAGSEEYLRWLQDTVKES